MTTYESIKSIRKQGIKSLNPDDYETLDAILKKFRSMLAKHDCKKVRSKNVWECCPICGKGAPRIKYD